MKQRWIRGLAFALGALMFTVSSTGCVVVGRRHHYRYHHGVTVVEPVVVH